MVADTQLYMTLNNSPDAAVSVMRQCLNAVVKCLESEVKIKLR